jgi:hypothetical protein
LALLGAAAVLGGCVGDASIEGDDEQETQAEVADPGSADAIDPDAAEAVGSAQQALQSKWWCLAPDPRQPAYVRVGEVIIWWGHQAHDAKWACNEWIKWCNGKCSATREWGPL